MKMVFFILTTLILMACGKSGEQKIQPDAPVQRGEQKIQPDTPVQRYEKADKARPKTLPDVLASTTPCSVDAIGEKSAIEVNLVTDKTKLKLAGWAGNVAEGTSQKEVWIEFVGAETAFVKASSGLKRPDVASSLRKPGLEDSGWEVFADLSALTGGRYDINVVMYDGKNGLTCNTGRAIQLN